MWVMCHSVHDCVCVYVCKYRCPQKPEEGVKSQEPQPGASENTAKSPAHKQVYLNNSFYITTDSAKNQLLQLQNCCCDVALVLYKYYTLR